MSTEVQPAPYTRQRSSVSAATGSRRLIGGFAAIIAIGTLLLHLPMATTGPEPISWVDAFFTATSAVTVTGLTVFSTATTFTLFGQIIILLLMQVGGIGFISLSIVLFRLAGRHVGMEERFLLRQTLGVERTSNIVRLTTYVLMVVVLLELGGAALLFVQWVETMPPGQAAYFAIFHSISAFCNAGFDLFSGTERGILFGYGTDSWTLSVLAGLILIGGLGIAVVDDLLRFPKRRRLTLHTKFTLTVTILLTLSGILVLLLEEEMTRGPLTELAVSEEFIVGAFTIISSRTAGITIVDLNDLSQATQLILMIWMFIGGAPSSMAGGVSTNTVAVIAVAMLATVRGDAQAVAYNRTMSVGTILKAVAVMTISTLLVSILSLILALLQQGDLFVIGFESISAFSNTGYSLGLTGDLSPAGRLLIAFTMFWGRLGPLTLVVVLTQRQRPSLVTYPDEKVILG